MRASKDISTKSPMSVTGFTTRYWRVTHSDNKAVTWLCMVPRVVFLLAAWAVLIVWNFCAWVLFFWFTLPWRLYRNSRRRDIKQEAEHAELMATLSETK